MSIIGLSGRARAVGIGTALSLASLGVPVVWGDHVDPQSVDLLDGAAWLGDDTGRVVHVNGETGGIDAELGWGGPIEGMGVEQKGDIVVVRVGGELRSLDVANLEWGATSAAANGQVIAAERTVYLVDPDGIVRLLDSVTLAAAGQVDLGSRPAANAATVGDRLVVPLVDGHVVVVDDGEVTHEIDAGHPGDQLTVTALGDRVAVLNRSAGELSTVLPRSGGRTHPVDVDMPEGEVIVPAELPRGPLWLLVPHTGELLSASPTTGEVRSVPVARPGSELAGPAVDDGHAYLVNRTEAELVQVDADTMTVGRREPLGVADASRVDIIAEGGKVFVNDPASALAIVVDGDRYVRIDKHRGLSGRRPQDRPQDTPQDPVPSAGATDAQPPPPTTPPAAPTQVQAQPGNASATVSWSLAGGSPTSSFQLTYDGLGSPIQVPGGERSVTVDGLDNGTTYVFEVWASNEVGDSDRSRSNPVVPSDRVPGSPTGVTATAGDASARVAWDAADDRGREITSYVVTAQPGGLTQETAGRSTEMDFSGLTNGTDYTFTVRAVNDLGVQSDASPPSRPVRPYGPPGQVPQVNVAFDDGVVTLDWEASPNQSPEPVRYQIAISPTAGGQGQVETPETTYSFSGLQNGVSYTFSIVPINDRGAGPARQASATPGRAPRVTSMSATRVGDRRFAVALEVDDGGRPVSGCTIALSSGGSVACDTGSRSVSVEVDVPTFDTAYTFTATVSTQLGDARSSADAASAPKPLTVDTDAARWDGATCSWPGHERTRPLLSGTQTCTGFMAWVPFGTTVAALCWTSGSSHRDDYLNQSTTFVRVSYGGMTGYMSHLYFTTYLDRDGTIAGLRAC